MEKEKREEFIKRMAAISSDGGSISEDWQRLVNNGTIAKLMRTEEEYKKSGGYPELSKDKEDIGKEPGE